MSQMDPWMMWGNTQIIEIQQTTTATPSIAGGQLVNVRYARPESWNFFFHAKLISTIRDDYGLTVCNFNVTQGVGRSHVTINAFETFKFEWSNLATFNNIVNNPKYSSTVKAPNRNDQLIATPDLPLQIDTLVAQDIQINVACYTGGLDLTGNVVKIEVSALITPKTHLRPEWFERIGKFRAGENKGF